MSTEYETVAGCYQVKTSKFCAGVEVNEQGFIIKTPPCYRKFSGQRIQRLLTWRPVTSWQKVM